MNNINNSYLSHHPINNVVLPPQSPPSLHDPSKPPIQNLQSDTNIQKDSQIKEVSEEIQFSASHLEHKKLLRQFEDIINNRSADNGEQIDKKNSGKEAKYDNSEISLDRNQIIDLNDHGLNKYQPQQHQPQQHQPQQHQPQQHRPQQHRPQQHWPQQHQPVIINNEAEFTEQKKQNIKIITVNNDVEQKLKRILEKQQEGNVEDIPESSRNSFSEIHEQTEKEETDENSQMDGDFLEQIKKNKEILQHRRQSQSNQHTFGNTHKRIRELHTIIETSLVQKQREQEIELKSSQYRKDSPKAMKKKKKKSQKVQQSSTKKLLTKNDYQSKMESMYDRRIKDYHRHGSENKILARKKNYLHGKNELKDPIQSNREYFRNSRNQSTHEKYNSHFPFYSNKDGDQKQKEEISGLHEDPHDQSRKPTKLSLMKSPSVPQYYPLHHETSSPRFQKKDDVHLPVIAQKKNSSKSLANNRKVSQPRQNISEKQNLFDNIHNILADPEKNINSNKQIIESKLKVDVQTRKMPKKNPLKYKKLSEEYKGSDRTILDKKNALLAKIDKIQKLISSQGQKDLSLIEDLRIKANQKLTLFDKKYVQNEASREQTIQSNNTPSQLLPTIKAQGGVAEKSSYLSHRNNIQQQLQRVNKYYEHNQRSLKGYVSTQQYLQSLSKEKKMI